MKRTDIDLRFNYEDEDAIFVDRKKADGYQDSRRFSGVFSVEKLSDEDTDVKFRISTYDEVYMVVFELPKEDIKYLINYLKTVIKEK